MEQHMRGAISAEQQMEIDLDNSTLDLNAARTAKLLAELNPNGDANRKLTEAQGKMMGGHAKMRRSTKGIFQLLGGKDGYDPTTVWSGVEDLVRSVPFSNFITSENKETYRTYGEEWIMGLLRPESGAVISETEMDRYVKTYLPQPGDAPNVVQMKMELMKDAEDDLHDILDIQGLGTVEVERMVNQRIANRSGLASYDVMKGLKTPQDVANAVKSGSLSESQGHKLTTIMTSGNDKGVSSGKSGKYTWTTNQ